MENKVTIPDLGMAPREFMTNTRPTSNTQAPISGMTQEQKRQLEQRRLNG